MDTHFFLVFKIVAAFIFGACVGSFLNVCAYRIPLGRSTVSPGSHCAACGAPIPPFRNIPIISWLWLRGRAACCGTRIEFRYFIVELLTAAIFAGLWFKYDPITALIFSVLVSCLIAASLIDLDHFIIPDRFSLGMCALGLLASTIHPALQGETTALQGFSWSLAGALIGGFSLLAIGWAGSVLFKKEAMGMGDVKFVAGMCAFFGGLAILWIIPVSAMLGSVLGLILIFLSNGSWGTRIPFGPFLALAAIFWLFGGSEFMVHYCHYQVNVVKMIFSPWVGDNKVPHF